MAKKTFPHISKKKSPSGNLPSADFKSCKIILQSKGVACCNLQKKQTSRAARDVKQSCRDLKDPARKRNPYKIYVHLDGSYAF